MYMFDKVFASFFLLTRKNLHKKYMHVNWHTHFGIWHVLWLVKKKKHKSIDTLEIKMTRITRQLEYYILQLKYPENITHNSRRNFYTHLHIWVQLCSCNFLCKRELRRWSEISRLIGRSARQCERGFSKPNAIKSHLRNRLNLKTRSIVLFFLLQIKIAYWLCKILVFLKYCMSQNWSDILE